MSINTLTGKGIGVAVLDTGIFPHMDFDNRIRTFADFVHYRSKPYDDNGHGTHVSGLIGGSGKASGGRHRGMAPECSLISLKVLDHNGNGNKEDVLQAFQWILRNKDRYGIRIVNISVGTTCNTRREHQLLISGVEEVWDAGLVVVAAAGNQGPGPGTITAPGSSRKVITVGSSDMLASNKGTSGRGPTMDCICKPDIVTPGHKIISCAPSMENGQFYAVKSGTSMSTPVISGAIALLLEKEPQLTNVEVKMRLKECAVDLGYPRNQQGWGKFSLDTFLSQSKIPQ